MVAPFVPAAGTCQVEMVYSTYGGKAENVYHVHTGGPGSSQAATFDAIAAAFAHRETVSFSGIRSNAYGLRNIVIRDISVQNGFAKEYPQLIIGQATDPPLPDNVTFAIKWSTGRAGRSYRGRTYHIGLTTTMVAADQLVSGIQAAMQADYSALITDITGINWAGLGLTAGYLAVVSKRQNKAWLANAVVTQILTAGFADINLDSQRRRLRGRGV